MNHGHHKSGVELAYIGVHEIFQMALAAHENGQLSGLQCSLFDAPGKWGRFARRFSRVPSASPLGNKSLPPDKVHELPLPLLRRQLASRLNCGHPFDPLPFFQSFERQAARRLRQPANQASIAVAAETCALGYFEEAQRQGIKCLLDAHGIPNRFLDSALQRAAQDFGLPAPPPCDSPAMEDHKDAERQLADVIVYCSELQRDIWIRLGVSPAKCRAVPLWVDADFWQPAPAPPAAGARTPLRVAAVGSGTLAKGLPYLLQATRSAGTAVHLTLAGAVAPDLQPLVQQQAALTQLPYLSRIELRAFLQTQHLLVMPSLGDSFGFVAMEAMACGLPVILTNHCGAPVPDPAWRVAAHCGDAIAQRLQHYLDDPARIAEESHIARQFAAQHTPERYRQQIGTLYSELAA